MELDFYKYQGTGNDFVMVDNRKGIFPKGDAERISSICDRRFGVGADGLILLETDVDTDFKMVYFNSDGRESTMCGNGGRCIVAFAEFLGIIKGTTRFMAIDGVHTAKLFDGMVSLRMNDVDFISKRGDAYWLDTGSPHHVQLVDDIEGLNVPKEGARLRYGLYGEAGSNINFVEVMDVDTFQVRTYERGVEDETLSCGTGVTAVAWLCSRPVSPKGTSIH